MKILPPKNEKIKIKRLWLRFWGSSEIHGPGSSWVSGPRTDIPAEPPSHRPWLVVCYVSTLNKTLYWIELNWIYWKCLKGASDRSCICKWNRFCVFLQYAYLVYDFWIVPAGVVLLVFRFSIYTNVSINIDVRMGMLLTLWILIIITYI